MSRPYELRVLEHLRNFREIAGKVKEIARAFDPGVKVFVFGSTVRGSYTALSDIDILGSS
ncbi:MAG: nucleotidyltransferase domain-containing protein [Desulfurococcaceae archaeon]